MEKLRHTEAVDTAQDDLSQRKRATAVSLDGKIEMSQYGELTTRMMVREVNLDVKLEIESTMRVDEESLEMSLEMSQQSELTTGARGSDARSRHEQAGKTPPIPPTGRSAREAEMVKWKPLTSDSRRSHKSQTYTCDT